MKDMKSAIMQMMEKKKMKSGMSDNQKDAKASVIEAMKKMAEDAMGDKVKGLKKVTVASNSPEGLKEGLEKAKSVISHPSEMMAGHMADAEDDSETPEEEKSESSDFESGEDEEKMSDAESAIDDMDDIAELQKLEEMIKAKKMELMKK